MIGRKHKGALGIYLNGKYDKRNNGDISKCLNYSYHCHFV
ncbi:hypothetical protein NC99_23640 [Sunxiuqinia dokdonensis]|uniref:Uncharacterized protein n=1 Tax=Sunxiuqinia dokdonensis TaxID=1409788 RepID=A0A0L8V9F8_9BACT|nr:hypothetical protein NC99_23640 [Sunxiuqinia dokdonensis]